MWVYIRDIIGMFLQAGLAYAVIWYIGGAFAHFATLHYERKEKEKESFK